MKDDLHQKHKELKKEKFQSRKRKKQCKRLEY